MLPRLIITSLFSFIGSLASFAQSSDSLHNARSGREDIGSIVGRLEQSALLAISGAVVLIGLMWICYILKACSGINKPQGNTQKPFLSGLLMVVGMSILCSSCSVEQQAMAVQYRKAEAAESHPCLVTHTFGNRPSYPWNSKYPNQNNADWYGYKTCKYCGQRVYCPNR